MDYQFKKQSIKKENIEQKAIQKCPFTLNNQTYFSSQCYYDDTIINGISLQISEGKGLSSNPSHLDYLNHSQKLIYHAGCNILAYNTYRRSFQIICQTGDLCILKALSLSSPEKQYIIWAQKIAKIHFQGQKIHTQLCVYSTHKKQRIHAQKFLTVHSIQEIFVFLHPIKVIGAIRYDEETKQSVLTFKKIIQGNFNEIDDQVQILFPYDMRQLKYQVESNTYLFSQQNKILCLKLEPSKSTFDDDNNPFKSSNQYNHQNFKLTIQQTHQLSTQIIHFTINEIYLAILIGDQSSRTIKFYSILNQQLVFQYQMQSLSMETQVISKANLEFDLPLINLFEFRKSTIVGVYGETSCISIYSVFDQTIRHVRNTELSLENCAKIQKIFVNPFSSQVMVASKHYQLESTVQSSIRSKRLLPSSQVRFKNFYLQISSFFITMEASMINVKKLGLSKRKYQKILTIPWSNDTFYQTQNSIICSRWEQKFDGIIRCSAIHPTGQFIALGFSDCFKIYYLTFQGLEHSFICQNVKQCTSLAFSQYGNQFSVAASCVIFVYESYSFIRKQQISLGVAHKIDHITYIKNNLYCISKTNRLWVFNSSLNYKEQFTFNPRNHIENSNIFDGLIFQMMKKNAVEKQKGNAIANQSRVNSIFYDYVIGMVIFSVVNKIYFISSKNYECLGCYDFQDVSCMQYCEELSTLFLGTVSGKIIAYPWPNKPINIGSQLPVYHCHNQKITQLKITTDLFYLISITQNCLYKHQLTMVNQMRKISKYELQREYCPSVILSLNFIQRRGLCLFSVDQYSKKYEEIKQNEEQALNVDFMLPQQRQKQKTNMLNKLESGRDECDLQLNQTYHPLKIEALTIKDKNKCAQEDLRKMRISYAELKSKEVEEYRQKISRLCTHREQLQKQINQYRISCLNDIKKHETLYRNQIKRTELNYYIQLSDLQSKNSKAECQKNKTINNFLELDQIDEQKKIYYREIIDCIDQEISSSTQRSGYLMCRNTNLQKQISSKKRKIEQILDIIGSIKRSINQLPNKNKYKKQQCNQKQAKNIFAETQKRYLKQTKKLIDQNKGVNVSIQMYSKQKDVLIELEKDIQNFDQQIDIIIDYLNKEKQQRVQTSQKLQDVLQRVKQIIQVYKVKTSQRIKLKNQYKTFKYNVALYLDGIMGLEKLKQFSEIASEDMIKAPVRIQHQINRKRKKIDKIITTQQKTINLMSSDRKIFSNQKKKMYVQNQDLLMTYNFLSHRNKYLANIKSQQDPRKMSMKIKASKRRKQNIQAMKQTPFQNYINFRTTRRMKTTPCAEYQI